MRGALHAVRAVAALAALVGASLGGFAACSSEECVGGVLVDGICQGKCEPDLCKDQNTCVANQCKLLCSGHRECNLASQECMAAVEDDTSAEILVCQSKTKGVGLGASCPFGQSQCESLFVCPDGSACGPEACGGRPDQCAPRADGSSACPDGTPCCAEDQCMPLSCRSAGEGDAEAYCTMVGCRNDGDCAGGFTCGVTRDAREICGTDKGNSNACGESDEPCIDLATAGETYVEGSMCALRKTCLKRAPCDPCENDLDCSTAAGMVCTSIGGSNRCAQTCNTDSDCEIDYACDAGACKPRFGSCEGDGSFCQPCQDDLDCGPGALCTPVPGLDKQKACLPWERPDPNAPGIIPALPCTTDADCPLTPGGFMHGECLNEDDGYAPADSGYGRCYFPFDSTVQKYGCWYECDVGIPFPDNIVPDPLVECPAGTMCREGFCE
ncbi:hypothetical protein [Chondromyces apiculatus]|uniref:hypothetical protein n=1 Tax=Chondromyces apiculatus TaxID=51 RepID=UPI0012DDB7C0|nr:hypothetical protein [Chondromyces apiculatus]